MDENPTPPPPDGPAPESEKPGPRILNSEELLGDADEVVILHGDLRYRLIRTKSDKLILHK